jgi:tetratricopeptide (TPR) repeat protein
MKRLVVVILATTLAACGGGQKHAATGGGGGGHASKAKRDPVNSEAYKEFEGGMRALRIGGPEAAETARARLKSAVSKDSKLWEAWFDLGVIAWKEGDDDEAVTDFTHALDINKGHTASLMARAEANRRGGHKKEARADYESALKAMEDDDPNRRDVAARLAGLQRDSGDYDDAVETLRSVVRTSGINAKIYTELGQIYLAQKRLELAQLVLAKALQLDAKDPTVYNALALLAARQGKAQESFQLFDQAASMDANYIDARFNKAAVLLDAGDYSRAKVELAAIVEKRADDYAAQVALGVAQRGLKEFPEAKRTWERVIKEAPKKSSARADAMWNLATLKLDFMEDASGGKADLERYLQEAPSGHSKRQDAENKCKEVKCR